MPNHNLAALGAKKVGGGIEPVAFERKVQNKKKGHLISNKRKLVQSQFVIQKENVEKYKLALIEVCFGSGGVETLEGSFEHLNTRISRLDSNSSTLNEKIPHTGDKASLDRCG